MAKQGNERTREMETTISRKKGLGREGKDCEKGLRGNKGITGTGKMFRMYVAQRKSRTVVCQRGGNYSKEKKRAWEGTARTVSKD